MKVGFLFGDWGIEVRRLVVQRGPDPHQRGPHGARTSIRIERRGAMVIFLEAQVVSIHGNAARGGAGIHIGQLIRKAHTGSKR